MTIKPQRIDEDAAAGTGLGGRSRGERKGIEPRRISHRLYSDGSSIYDSLWGRLGTPRIARGIELLGIRPGDRILDLGVGTGLSLSLYPRTCRVVAVDSSRQMLERARRRAEREGLEHVDLRWMDALELEFDDAFFDRIFSSFVLSVVSDPVRVLREILRVGRPGSTIVLVNHFRSDRPVLGLLEKLVSPLCERLGWRSDLSLHDLARAAGLEIRLETRLRRLDLWRIVVAAKPAPRARRQGERDAMPERLSG